MNRQALVVLLVGGVLLAGGALFLSSRSDVPDAPVAVADRAPVAEPATPSAAPAPVTPPPARPAATAPPVTRPTPVEPEAPAAPTTATLHISSDVPGAQVFVDRKFIGEAPVTAEGVMPGVRQINVSAPGYEGVAESVTVEPGARDIVISLKTIRLDRSLAVVHKHRFGSCTGTLIATPEGLRYETTDKNDGFSAPLTSLETFEVDFAAKNLKVKVAKGRSYDFTSPDGEADPLYFFHQEVDKVRQRLMKGGR